MQISVSLNSGQAGLQNELQDSQNYIHNEALSQKTHTKKEKKQKNKKNPNFDLLPLPTLLILFFLKQRAPKTSHPKIHSSKMKGIALNLLHRKICL